jgi:integrase
MPPAASASSSARIASRRRCTRVAAHCNDVADLVAAGRGATTIRRIIAVLSSALSDAVEQRRVTHNAAQHVVMPKVVKGERPTWSAAQAVTFLDHVADDPLGPLFEVLVGCGLRRGEGLALRWSDVDLDARVLYVRRTLSDVNGRLVFSEPKTRASAAGVGLPSRVVAALRVQQMRQDLERAEWGSAYQDGDLVFAREDGSPIRPEHVTKRFGPLCAAAGVPKIRIHDLRHTAATLMIGSGVPLPVVSKVLRHSQLSITADLYGHLTPEIAMSAADVFGTALDAAAAERAAEHAAARSTQGRLTTDSHDLENDNAGPLDQENPQVTGGAPRGNRTPNPLIKRRL